MIRAAVVAPSGPGQPERVAAGIATLHGMGVTPVFSAPPSGPRHYLAGSDAERAQALVAAFEEPGVDWVWALRGGFGASRTLAVADRDRLAGAAHWSGRPFVGFSDATVLLNWLADAADRPMLHGPVVTQVGELSDGAREALAAELGRGRASLPLISPRARRDGRGTGRLLGGNLASLAALVGTPWMPRLVGAVLFLEDVGEPVYRLDRMLTQLRQSGALAGLAGLLLGSFTGVAAGEQDALEHLLDELAAEVEGPVASGLAVGHTPDNYPVWVGRTVTLRVSDGEVAAEYGE